MAMMVLTKENEGMILVNTEDISFVETINVGTDDKPDYLTRIQRRHMKTTEGGGSITIKESIKQIYQLYERMGLTPIALREVSHSWIRLDERDATKVPDATAFQESELYIWEIDGQLISRKWADVNVYRAPGTVEFVRWNKEKGIMYGKDKAGKVTELRRWTTAERPI